MRMEVIYLVAALAAMAVPAHAEVTVDNKTNIALNFFLPCAAGGAGEVVDLRGTLHTLVSFTINANNISGYFHFQPDAITGTGETTGAKYTGTGVTEESFTNSLQNGQAIMTFVNNFRIIGQGSGNNYLVHETLHITINADGTTTVSHDNFTIDCQ